MGTPGRGVCPPLIGNTRVWRLSSNPWNPWGVSSTLAAHVCPLYPDNGHCNVGVTSQCLPQVWSEDLRSQAVASQCRFPAPDNPQVGWNVQRVPAGTAELLDVIRLWYRHGSDYYFRRVQCANNRTCNHYTQMVWATSWELGCAIGRCPSQYGDTDMMVCGYSPGGNWDIGGQIISPYQSGSWCSFCTATWSGCFKTWEQRGGLCEVPRNPCRVSCKNYGHLNTTNCQCHCAPGYTGRYCQVRCRSRCVHGRYKEDECSCVCRPGYGGGECTDKLPSSAPSCDIRSDRLCFTISSLRHSYYEAKKDCQRSGGFLARVTTQKIQDISNNVTDGTFQNFWIGLTYKPTFRSSRWGSGDPLTFQSFALGQPDKPRFGNCIELSAAAGFHWRDQQCKIQNRYICQHKI
ncbi:LOW QUALITY PROTEIN: C-type lectin domain family 18 member C-like [Pyxicephalus adspersus]|uniref:LOW QUALITY PROTEIN: C-type lectin domain family 18 member C-like n=1 Tax=Pyxicephalus adspersus TaxID=30357 RepID=UPI003B5C552B